MESQSDILPQQIDSLILSLKKTPNDYKTVVDILRYLRNNKCRRSDFVVTYAEKLIKEQPNVVSEIEGWDVREQLFIAALDVNNLQLAGNMLVKIKKQFGDKSIRVRKLIGLHREALGKFKEADQIYASILEDDPVNMPAMKRQIAIRKALGDVPQTVRLLNEYLKIFSSDADAWQELADLYLEQQMYKNAAFCYEELILATPGNYHFYSKYAEILFTIGGYENLRTARKYYAHSLEMNDSNLRSLYGLLMTTIAIESTKQGRQDADRGQDPENMALYDWSYQKLANKYKEIAPQKLQLLRALGKDKGKEEL